MSADPTREYPTLELDSAVHQCGGWLGWLGQGHEPSFALAALRWKANQGDELPEELEELRDAIAQFGHPPIEEAVARVQGLEKAFADIARLLPTAHLSLSSGPSLAARTEVSTIVESCVKFSGCFGTADAPEVEL